MINRIRNYDYVNKELRSQNEQVQPPEAPPIIQHKDNVSQLTIYNTGWTEGYTEGYKDGKAYHHLHNQFTLTFFTIVGFILGLSIGIWL